MDQLLLAYIVGAFLLGLIIGWAIARAAARRALEDASAAHQGALTAQQTLFAETARRLGEVQEELRDSRQDLQAATVGSVGIREENAQLRTELAHQKQVVPEQLALLQQAQLQL